jgi:hypothetical protein
MLFKKVSNDFQGEIITARHARRLRDSGNGDEAHAETAEGFSPCGETASSDRRRRRIDQRSDQCIRRLEPAAP